MTVHEPIWCEFCQDRPAVGRMVLMINETRKVVPAAEDTPTHACNLHGRAWTGSEVGRNKETGDVAVFQYVHPDWSHVTEQQVVEFSGDRRCSVCGDFTGGMPVWVAERILRMHPEIVLDRDVVWEGVCDACAHEEQCPHCNEEED